MVLPACRCYDINMTTRLSLPRSRLWLILCLAAAALGLGGLGWGLAGRLLWIDVSGTGAGRGVLVPLGTHVWRRDEPDFGGFSALAISGQGSGMIALTDRGYAYGADILRKPEAVGTETGAIRELAHTTRRHLLDPKGKVLRPYLADAEDMALAPNGSLYVAFESYGRILHYSDLVATPTWTHRWNRFEQRFGNLGFEALAALPQGGLLAIAEAALPGVDPGTDPPAFCRDAAGWHRVFALPDPQGFAVSGADVGPDGKLYLLERKTAWPRGFSTRIRRFSLLTGPKAGTDDTGTGGPCALHLGPAETLLHTPFGALGNMEAISLWQSAEGQTILTLISDNNFSRFQRTMLAEYTVTR